MDLDREGLPIVCYTARGILKGRVALLESAPTADSVQMVCGGPPLLHLVEATLMDDQHRIVHRAREMAVNRNAILFAHEDDMASDLARLKGMIAREDYDTAAAEVDRLLATNQRDAELLYLAGLVYEHLEGDSRAREYFQKALELIADEKFRAVVRHHLG